MKKIMAFLCAVLVANSFSLLYARMYESMTIVDVLDYIDLNNPVDCQNTLVIFDIDNTLAAPAGVLGSDQWFEYMVSKWVQKGLTVDQAVSAVLPTYLMVHFRAGLEPIEECTVAIIHRLQAAGVRVMCLTTRSFFMAVCAEQQLARIGLRFALPEVDSMEEIIIGATCYPALYLGGILFCGANTKSSMLKLFFDQIRYQPGKIIFMDDKHKNIMCLENAFTDSGIEYIGLRYGACDERVKAFNPAHADILLTEFMLEQGIQKSQYLTTHAVA